MPLSASEGGPHVHPDRHCGALWPDPVGLVGDPWHARCSRQHRHRSHAPGGALRLDLQRQQRRCARAGDVLRCDLLRDQPRCPPEPSVECSASPGAPGHAGDGWAGGAHGDHVHLLTSRAPPGGAHTLSRIRAGHRATRLSPAGCALFCKIFW